MVDKNPYENQKDEKTLNIPNFFEEKSINEVKKEDVVYHSVNNDINVEVKEETVEESDPSVDMSIFKMSDDELYDDYTESERTVSERKKRRINMPLLVCLALIFLLLATTIASLLYAMKQRDAYVKANTSYLQMLANEDSYKKQIEEKDALIADLESRVNNTTSTNSSSSSNSNGTSVYVITDGGMYFRSEPRVSASYVTYNGLEQVSNGEKYNVIEVVNDSEKGANYPWAKVADGVYFALGSLTDPWADKVE